MASPNDLRQEQMFPSLTEAQIARIANIGRLRDVRAGEILFESGAQNTGFFVVVQGALEIVRPVGDKEESVTVLGQTHLEAQTCGGEELAVVGGGNSAGQAAVFLSQVAKKVNVLVRGKSLADSMSRYLIQRIEDSRNVTLRTLTEIAALEGNDRLERVRWRRVDTGEEELRPIRNLFSMTGADPNTAWLSGCVQLDEKGFVKTGADLQDGELSRACWPLPRRPYLLESSTPGVFVVGDARAASVKRVAAAVGEGSICVQLIHRFLQET